MGEVYQVEIQIEINFIYASSFLVNKCFLTQQVKKQHFLFVQTNHNSRHTLID